MAWRGAEWRGLVRRRLHGVCSAGCLFWAVVRAGKAREGCWKRERERERGFLACWDVARRVFRGRG